MTNNLFFWNVLGFSAVVVFLLMYARAPRILRKLGLLREPEALKLSEQPAAVPTSPTDVGSSSGIGYVRFGASCISYTRLRQLAKEQVDECVRQAGGFRPTGTGLIILYGSLESFIELSYGPGKILTSEQMEKLKTAFHDGRIVWAWGVRHLSDGPEVVQVSAREAYILLLENQQAAQAASLVRSSAAPTPVRYAVMDRSIPKSQLLELADGVTTTGLIVRMLDVVGGTSSSILVFPLEMPPISSDELDDYSQPTVIQAAYEVRLDNSIEPISPEAAVAWLTAITRVDHPQQPFDVRAQQDGYCRHD